MPNNKMERFTQRARQVLSLAQEEAERLRHNYIGTEHLLLGLLREEGGVAGRVLRDLGLELPRTQALIEELTRATARPTTTTAELSPGTKHALELSVDEARRMGHHYIGTEHLILGLVRQSEGVAIDVLKRLGVTPEEVRRQTRRVLQETPVQTPAHRDEVETKTDVPTVGQHSRPNEAAYDILQDLVHKTLTMINEDKLSVAQAVELLSTFTPDLQLDPNQQAALMTQIFDQKKYKDYNVQLASVDAAGNERFVQAYIPFPDFLAEIDRCLASILNDPEMPMTFHIGLGKIELRLKKADSPS